MSAVDKKPLKKMKRKLAQPSNDSIEVEQVPVVAEEKTSKSAKKAKVQASQPEENDSEVIEVSTTPAPQVDDVLFDFDPNGTNIDYSFDSLDINANTRKAIEAMGFTRMTEVQARTIPVLLVCISFTS